MNGNTPPLAVAALAVARCTQCAVQTLFCGLSHNVQQIVIPLPVHVLFEDWSPYLLSVTRTPASSEDYLLSVQAP